MELGWIARGFSVALLLGLPLMASRGGIGEEQVQEVAESRRAVYVSAGFSLLILAGLTWAVAWWRRLPPAAVGWRAASLEPAAAWAVGVTAAGLAAAWLLAVLLPRMGLRESPLVAALMPRTGAEKVTFLLLAAVSAVCEEYLFRGFLLHVLSLWGVGTGGALALTSLSFGLSHGYQRAAGVIRATLLGALFGLAVLRTGSLFAAVTAHFWINAAIGMGGWRRLVAAGGDLE